MMKQAFLADLDKAIASNRGIKVYVTHPNLLDPEVIINSARNVEEKRAYYDATYNDDMELSRFPMIRIDNVELID